MYLRIQPDTLRQEVDQVLAVIVALKERIDQGIPGPELPSNDVNIETFLIQLHGELLLASGRLATIAEVLEGDG